MTRLLRHRGPDHQGSWADASAGVWLGHARLSILDVSPSGHQPMESRCGRYIISYNGEIYNFKSLRSSLKDSGHSFHSSSDTEVMLAAISQWGLLGAVQRFNGMFAFALWDRTKRTLQFARDRLGEKPLYYGFAGRTLLFASELKAFRAHPDFKARVDRAAVALYLRFNNVPAPYCIYKGVFKLPPGTILTVPDGALDLPAPEPYWTLQDAVCRGQRAPEAGRPEQAVDALEDLLRDSVRIRMESDVPLGAFLSGGIDSSTVVALMAAQSSRPIQTFTVGFDESAFDEAVYAGRIAAHLQTDHTDLRLTSAEAIEAILRLPVIYDEPFADSSQIPTFLVSQLARKNVTVSLSGDGGDELFGGYNRYFVGRALWEKVRICRPMAARGGSGSGARRA